MTRAYLVLGAESSGTRLMTQIMIAGGCQGCADMLQPFDYVIPPARTTNAPIVWRRSVPHARKWPSINALIHLLVARGYEPCAVVIQRDWMATAQSQLKAGHVKSVEQATKNIERAHKHIMRGLADIPYVAINYEALVSYPVVSQLWLAAHLGLPAVPKVKIYDGNEKWLNSPQPN